MNHAQEVAKAESRLVDQQEDNRVTFEEALQVVGSFGLYQKRLVMLICLTCSVVVMQNMAPVFTMRIPKHRCKVPGYTNDTYAIHSDFHRHLVNQTIPIADKGGYSKCTVYVVNNDATSYNRTIQTCSDWVYDKSEFSSTFVTQLNLVCEYQIYRSHSTMAVSAGKFFGALITSVLGDYFGRRRVYTFMMLLLAAASAGLVFPFNLILLVVLRFLIGVSTTGAYLCLYVIGTEVVGASQRRWFSTAASFSGSVGTFVGVLIAYLTRNGQYFQAGLAVPCIPVIIGYFFIPESPRWLASKGRHDEAQNVIDVIARVNGVSKAPPRITTMDKSRDSEESKDKAVSPLQLFRIPRLFVRYSLLYLSWMFVAMCFYGLIFNVSNMSGDIFLNYTIMSVMGLASIVLFTCLVDRVGRRPLLAVSSGLGGLACLASFLPVVLDANSWILRGLSFFGRLCMSCAFETLYIMSPELFPTVFRSFGLGSCSMMARVGTMASPYVADLNILISGLWGPALPQIVFGVAGVLTAVTTLVQPETKGRSLPETVQQAAAVRRSKRVPVKDAELESLPPSSVVRSQIGT